MSEVSWRFEHNRSTGLATISKPSSTPNVSIIVGYARSLRKSQSPEFEFFAIIKERKETGDGIRSEEGQGRTCREALCREGRYRKEAY